MDRNDRYALDAAKEITIARMTNITAAVTKDCGEDTANFFEAVFTRIQKIARDAEEANK